MTTDRDRRIAARVEAWFATSARDLPWRARAPGDRDAYHALVCETMAQQTQIARVAERFVLFIERFPTVAALAAADPDDVRALWSGLGYYRRAANLHAAAKMVMETFGGKMPRTVGQLRRLPGVGAYTAGAVASMACEERVAAVDGNVSRVLMRIEGRRGTTNDASDRAWAWQRAEQLVQQADSPGALNEGLMELGATVCTPASPRCLSGAGMGGMGGCPLARLCRAKREGIVDEIPAPAKVKARSQLFCDSVLVEDCRGRVLIERRPEMGMWAGLWQAPTVEGARRTPRARIAEVAGVPAGQLERIETFTHITTHRTVLFTVWRAKQGVTEMTEEVACPRGTPRGAGSARMQVNPRAWRTRDQIAQLGLSRPQRRILLGP